MISREFCVSEAKDKFPIYLFRILQNYGMSVSVILRRITIPHLSFSIPIPPLFHRTIACFTPIPIILTTPTTWMMTMTTPPTRKKMTRHPSTPPCLFTLFLLQLLPCWWAHYLRPCLHSPLPRRTTTSIFSLTMRMSRSRSRSRSSSFTILTDIGKKEARPQLRLLLPRLLLLLQMPLSTTASPSPPPFSPSSAPSPHHQNNNDEDSGRQGFAALSLSSPTSSTAAAAAAATTAFLRERHGWFRQPPYRDLTPIPLTPMSREEGEEGEKD